MWDASTMQQLYKELDLPLPKSESSDVDVMVDHIYVKYFKDPGFDPVSEQKDITHHFRTLLNLNVRTNQTERSQPTSKDIWIFGYGSLVWKADFPYIDRKRGFICRYQRRFYQHSIDHRGTPDRPGRVVTLVATDKKDDRVYGMAYRVSASQKDHVLAHLDNREKNGYKRCTVKFQEYPDGEIFSIIMYIAAKDNQSYAGKEKQISRIVDEIITSFGPSGSNREYLFKLAEAMRELFPDVYDDHLFDLEKAVRERIDEDEEEAYELALKQEISIILAAGSKQNTVPSVKEAARRLDNLRNWSEEPGSRELLVRKVFKVDNKESAM